MILDNSLSADKRLGQNLAIYINKIDTKGDDNITEEIVNHFDDIITKVLTKKIGFTSPSEEEYQLPFSTKIDLCANKGVIGSDLKRMLQIFNEMNQNKTELESEENQALFNELIQLCDNELFRLINVDNSLSKDMGLKESLVYIFAVLAAALVESLVE